MSRKAYELLGQVGLLVREDHPADLACFDEVTLREKLDHYYKSRAEGAETEIVTERAERGTFAALRSSISCIADIEQLLPSALVYHRFYVDDPLFRAAQPSSENTRAYNRYLGLRTDVLIDRKQVAQSLAYLASVAPLVRAGLCSIIPVSLLHRAPNEIPIFASEDCFASAVPETIRGFVHNSAVIHEVMPLPDGAFAICNEPPKEPTRGIQIAFHGDTVARSGMFYLLFEARPTGKIKDGRVTIEQSLNWDNKPSQEQFDIWVTQSINKTAINRLAAVSSELHLADGLNATYVTESAFESKLLGLESVDAPRSLRENAVNFLTANAPFIGAASPEAVVRLRHDYPGLFEKFQASLLHVSSQLIGVEADYEEKAKALYVKEIEPQVRDINSQLSKVKWQSGSSAVLATAATLSFALTKAAAVPFSVPLAMAFGAVAFIQAAGGVLPAVGDYLQKRKGPAYIWSKLAKS